MLAQARTLAALGCVAQTAVGYVSAAAATIRASASETHSSAGRTALENAMALRAREEGFTAALGREKMPEVRCCLFH